MQPMNYKDYKYTIQLFNPKNENVLVPIKKWVARSVDCQPIVPYQTNAKTDSEVGMVLERLLVIDLDVDSNGKNGIEEFHKWVDKQSEDVKTEIKQDMEETLNVETPSGGVHIYFMLPPNVKTIEGQRTVGFMEGVDLLMGRNTYVPAPNSERTDGKYQRIEETPETISIAPQWVIELFKETSKRNTTQDGNTMSKWGGGNETVNKKGKMYQLIRTMREGFEEGSRNDNMASLCGTVLKMVKFGLLTNEDAQFIVLTTGRNSKPPMLDKEIETCWNSILRKENQN